MIVSQSTAHVYISCMFTYCPGLFYCICILNYLWRHLFHVLHIILHPCPVYTDPFHYYNIHGIWKLDYIRVHVSIDINFAVCDHYLDFLFCTSTITIIYHVINKFSPTCLERPSLNILLCTVIISVCVMNNEIR